MNRRLALLALLFAAATAQAQTEPPPAAEPAAPAPVPAPPPPASEGPRVALVTSAGTITLVLDRVHAPVTVANFLKYVDQKRFNGITFYRALTFPGDTPLGLIQAGIRGRSDKVLPPIAHEPTSKTGLSHINGAISMARAAPGSAQGDFFIIVGDRLTGLDANAKDPGYAVFGHVVDGMDTVLKILAAPVSATAGEGAMKGQMIAAPIAVSVTKRVK